MDSNQVPRKSSITIRSVSTVVVMVVLVVGYAIFNKKFTVTPNDVSINTGTNQEVIPNRPIASTYKDGIYTAVGGYLSPGGQEQVSVTLTLEGDIITDAKFEPMAERPISIMMQNAFAADYKQFVVGKNIDEVNLTKVSSSSLTPQGFNDAVNKIKVEAKS